VWWSGLLMVDAKKGIELNLEIKNEAVEGKTYYFFDSKFEKKTKEIFLLPNYDEYTVAFRDREVHTKNVDISKLDFRQNSLFNHVILIDGRIEGVWRRTIKSKYVEIETKLFKELNAREKEELGKAQQKYASFLELNLQTT
ncbi:MAG: winged helix DNA-binding domain-containing protein, partial [Ignavibacteria bacterium]|nr:winged helix DNA-binding domain-containing protein [Ignavibacteria bacterium]